MFQAKQVEKNQKSSGVDSMSEKGRQTPTKSYIIPYENTRGQEAIDLYNSTGKTAQEWQELLMFDIMALNEDDLWLHTKFGYSVPRRNGKNEVVVIREMIGLVNGEHILHTAHRTTTTHSAFERLLDRLELANIKIESSYKAYGKEHLYVEGGGKIEFRTRTAKGGLGEGFDLLVIDEAQEYQDDQESALKYVVSDSQNPQTIFCGTPPTPTSSGMVFTKLRESALSGKAVDTGWAEWSVEEMVNPREKEWWYETNPSLNVILSERKILAEIGDDDVDFNIQRLGYWTRYSLKSAISQDDWDALKINELPKLKGKLFVGIKYSADNSNVAMSIAVKTRTDKIFVESIDCQPTRNGTNWMIRFLKNADVENVVIDGRNGIELMQNAMKDNGIKKPPIILTTNEYISANSLFTEAIEVGKLCHKGQPSLTQSVTNCEKRLIGSNGGFGYKSLNPSIENALMDSVILAYYSCQKTKERRKQKISY